ncbi:MAG: ShlB/FhaC/HecB family hemolysin secretion/activation protein [Phycisphaeraceae bacterium]
MTQNCKDSPPTWGAACVAALWLVIGLACTVPALAATAEPTPASNGGAPVDAEPTFSIRAFVVSYRPDRPRQPPLAALLDYRFKLGVVDGEFVEPGRADTEQVVEVSLAQLSDGQDRVYRASALRTITAAIVQWLSDRGLLGVRVVPAPAHIVQRDQRLVDLRSGGEGELELLIMTATVGQLRTVAHGPRFAEAESRENHPAHRQIVHRSPLAGRTGEDAGDVVRRDELEDYLFQLNRHPGRRVDVAVSRGEAPGDVGLDFLVTERKPWLVYAQLSNTGTRATCRLRQRFGFIHNQLTDNDDILSLDYLTAGFDRMHAAVASYEAPLGDVDRMRYRLFTSYSEFRASDVGLPGEDFRGDEWTAGGEVIHNVFQQRELFVDLVAGLRYRRIAVDSFIADDREGFLLPYLGVQLERQREVDRTFASLELAHSLDSVAGTDAEGMAALGRTNTRERDEGFTLLTGQASHAFYLEPLLNPEAWHDPETPDNSTLAHEIAVQVRGQTAFDHRLVPQFQQVAGGRYTVRGYDEAIVAGDHALFATAEYRLHLPRLLHPRDPDETPVFGRPFRVAPEAVYGRPDWDLVLRGFVDVGRVWTNDRRSAFEANETLVGTGVGLELLLKHNLSLRGDWGVALRDAGRNDAGHNRLHFVLTVLY